jgi:hypothetical protein
MLPTMALEQRPENKISRLLKGFWPEVRKELRKADEECASTYRRIFSLDSC